MNLKNLAKTLGISETTVSRALNGYPEVSARTRARVLEAAEKAGYQPNPAARTLALGRTNAVGIIYPLSPNDLVDPMFVEIVGGMSIALEERQMDLVISPVSSRSEFSAYERIVRARRVDGLILNRTRIHDKRIAFLVEHGLPFVAHGRTMLNAPHAWFDYDNEAGMRMAAEHLLRLGHVRIALVSADLDMTFARQRHDSFIASMHAAGLAVDPAHVMTNNLERRDGYRATMEILMMSPRPTAIVVDNQVSGAGAVRALIDAGVKLGEEISLIVWGVLEDALSGYHVTTITQPHPELAGMKMVEMLLSIYSGTPPETLQELWQPVLTQGETVGACHS